MLSLSLSKQEDGIRLGAKEHRATSDDSTFADLAGSLDLIVNTVSAQLPIDAHLSLLKPGGYRFVIDTSTITA